MNESNDWRIDTLAVTAGRDHGEGAPFNVPPTFASTYRDGGPVGYLSTNSGHEMSEEVVAGQTFVEEFPSPGPRGVPMVGGRLADA